MPYSEKLFACPQCGQTFFKRASAKAAPLCILCAIGKAAGAQLQLSQRIGPTYERWIQGMERAVADARARVARAREQ